MNSTLDSLLAAAQQDPSPAIFGALADYYLEGGDGKSFAVWAWMEHWNRWPKHVCWIAPEDDDNYDDEAEPNHPQNMGRVVSYFRWTEDMSWFPGRATETSSIPRSLYYHRYMADADWQMDCPTFLAAVEWLAETIHQVKAGL